MHSQTHHEVQHLYKAAHRLVTQNWIKTSQEVIFGELASRSYTNNVYIQARTFNQKIQHVNTLR